MMAGPRKGCQSSVSYPCIPCCGRTGQMWVKRRMQRELLLRKEWTGLHTSLQNAMQLVAETIRTITGMIKRRILRRRMTLTDSSSTAKSLVSWYLFVLVTIGIFVDSCDSGCFMLYRN